MATVTFEDVPATFVKKYGTTVSFREFLVEPKKLTFRERMEDLNNTSYGPYSAEEFVDIMRSWQ